MSDTSQHPDDDAIALEAAREIALMQGQDRAQFVAKIQVRVISAIRTALVAQGQSPASPSGMPDADDMAQLKKAVEDWNDGVDTDVPQSTLMRLTELGLLVAEQFEVTKKGMDFLAAAPSAPEGGEVGL